MKNAKDEIQNGVILILAFIIILLFGINWELQQENDAMAQDHNQEMLQAQDNLNKAIWHIELLNKEREAE